jgi:ATP-binding cassette subfamily B multidrug efflux pump
MFIALFRRFESRIQATATPPSEAPPPGLLAFYWHFVRQSRGLFAAMLQS